jgi:hypothetical protein
MTDGIYQGIHQVREENHQKVEGAVTSEDVYGWGHPRIFKILPSAPQRQNENAGVRYQRGNPERGFRQFLSLSLKIVLYVSVLTKDFAITRQYAALVK